MRRLFDCLVVLAVAAPAGAAVWCVDDDNLTGIEQGTALYPFATVQAAVAAAAPGDMVKVARGHYPEAVWVRSTSLTLIGGWVGAASYGSGPGDFETRDADPSLTWVEGTSAAATVRLTDTPGSRVEGFRITGGRHGVLVDEEAWPSIVVDVTISGCLVELNGATDVEGGGVNATGADLAIVGCTVRDNVGSKFAGVYLHHCANALVEGNLIEGNVGHGDHGGGLTVNGWGTIRSNLIRGNRIGESAGYGWGGGVLVVEAHDQPTLLTHDVITGNHAPSAGGGVFVDEGATATLDHELVAGNTGPAHGGGVYVDQSWDGRRSRATLLGCTVAGNESTGWVGLGAGISVQGSDAELRDTIVWGNLGAAGADDFHLMDGGTLTATYTLSFEPLTGAGNLSLDPQFADPAAGDYHLESSGGRWDPDANAWVADPVDSPGIDAGDPGSPYANEPEPNGDRVNLGCHGNTAEASRSPGAGELFRDGFETGDTGAWAATVPACPGVAPRRAAGRRSARGQGR